MAAVKPSSPVLRQSHPLAQGLVGCWPLHEGGGLVANDLSGRGNSGTLTGSVSWSAGQSGYALSLDGSSGYVQCADPGLTSAAAKSVFAWVSPTFSSNGTFPRVLQINTATCSAALVLYDASNSAFAVGGTPNNNSVFGLTTQTFPAGAWHHVGWTFDGSTWTVYVDGVAWPTNTTQGSFGFTGSGLVLGARLAAAYYTAGLLGSVSLWSRALSPQEAAQDYEDSYRIVRRSRTVLKTAVAVIGACLRNLIVSNANPYPEHLE